MNENPYQSPAAQGARPTARRSVVRVVLSTVCFLGAAFMGLMVIRSYQTLRLSVELGAYSLFTPQDRAGMLTAMLWAGVNVFSFGLVGAGLWSGRRKLTAFGGGLLACSFLIVLAARFL